MKKNRIASLLLAASLCISQVALPVQAAQVNDADSAKAVITIGTGTLENATDKFYLPVTVEIKDNETAVDAIGLQFDYDHANLNLDTVAKRDDKKNKSFIQGEIASEPTLGTAVWATLDEDAKISAENLEYEDNNILFWLVFQAKSNYFDGDYEITGKLIDDKASNFAAGDDNVDVYFAPGTITLSNGLDADSVKPTINTHPASATYTYGQTPAALTVAATAATGASDLAYQWYKNTTKSATGGTAITGATSESYTLTLTEFGTAYYYCAVSNVFNGETYTRVTNVAAITYERADVTGVTLTPTSFVYDGTEKTVTATVKSGSTTLTAADYDVDATDNALTGTAVGTYTYKVTGKGNYKSSAQAQWKITEAEITATASKITLYLGSEPTGIAPYLTVTTKGSQQATISYDLTSGSDCVTLDKTAKTLAPVKVGTATVKATITADNHKDKEVSIDVEVQNKRPLPATAMTFNFADGTTTAPTLTYMNTMNGKALSEIVSAATISAETYPGGAITYTLKKDNEEAKSATLEGDNATKITDAGSYTVTATFENATYRGSKELTFTVLKAIIDTQDVTVTWANYTADGFTYDGTEKSITASLTHEELEIGGCTGNTATDAGNYEAVAVVRIKADLAKNYQLEDGTSSYEVRQSWKINKAEAITGLTVADQKIRFNDTSVRTLGQDAVVAPNGESLAGFTITDVTTSGDDIFAANSVKAVEDNKKLQFALKDGMTISNVDESNTITVTFDTKNYKTSTVTVTVEVIDKNDVSSLITFADQTATYNGLAQTVKADAATISAGTNPFTYEYSTDGTAWNVSPKDAGEYQVKAVYDDETTHGEKIAKFTIEKAALTVTGATVADKVYDGLAAATVTAVSFSGTVNNEQLAATDDYTTIGTFTNYNAGEERTADVTVALVADGPISKNYILAADDASASATAKITPKAVTIAVTFNAESFVFNNSERKPEVTVALTGEGVSELAIVAADYEITFSGDLVNATPANASDELKPTVKVTAAEAGNYTFDAVTKTYTITKASAPVLAVINKIHKAGTAVEDVTVALPKLPHPGPAAVTYTVGTLVDEDSILATGEKAPKVDEGTLTYGVLESGEAEQTATIPVIIGSQNYENATINVVITLTNKDVPTVKANDIVKTYNGEALTDSDITGTASVPGTWSLADPTVEIKNAADATYTVTVKFTPNDTENYAEVEDWISVTINKATPAVTVTCTKITEAGKTLADAVLTATGAEGTVSWDDPAGTEVTANKAFGWTFTPADTINYEVVTGTLTPYAVSSGNYFPVGGSGGPTAPTTTTTTTNPDGSVTTTVTDNRTGTVTATTQKPDGSTEVVETKKDGTITATTTDAEGGKVVKVTEPNKDVTITVTDPENEILAKVEIPAEIPESPIQFVDVPEGHWAEDAINQAAGLGLVNGVGDDRFDWNGYMKRGDLAAILRRLSNGSEDYDLTFDDVPADKYYAGDVAWAAKTGVVNGFSETEFGPEETITREQLATMLYRYAALLKLDTATSADELDAFNDGGNTNSWAVDGMAWCVKNGIIQGMGDDTLAPGVNTTRAEVTLMLQRFMNLITGTTPHNP